MLPKILSNKKPTYLADHEVDFVLLEDLELLPEHGLDGFLADAAQVGGCLADAARHQPAVLLSYLTGNVTRRLVDLGALERRTIFRLIL
jgi:hypothetical protein